MKPDRNDLITRFLLGDLSESERREVEERFLGDNEFFEQIMATEDALLDQYQSGTLSEEEHARAKALFESSREQRRNAEFTKELRALVKSGMIGVEPSALNGADSSPQIEPLKPESPIFNPAIVTPRTSALWWVAIAFMAVLLGLWVVYLNYQRGKLLGEQAAAEEKARQANESLLAEIAIRNQLKQELEAERQQRQQAEDYLAQSPDKYAEIFTTVVLRPAATERTQGSTLPTFKVNKPLVRIQLLLDTDRNFEKYQVSIATFGGERPRTLIVSSDRVRQGKLTVVLPADALGFDDFKIELQGASTGDNFERIADYVVRLTR